MIMTLTLATFLSADRVILGLTADSQRALVDQLIKPLIAARIVGDGARFAADVLAREQEITTVMENGVALPHARSNAVKRLGLAVGIMPEPGMQYNLEGDVPSRLFFLIAVPAFAPTAHMPLLQRLAQFAREPKRVERLLASKTPSVAVRYLGNYKG